MNIMIYVRISEMSLRVLLQAASYFLLCYVSSFIFSCLFVCMYVKENLLRENSFSCREIVIFIFYSKFAYI